MGSQKPILSADKPDLVAVILERSVAQQLALALAWALGSTGGGKTKNKGTVSASDVTDTDAGTKPVLSAAPKMVASSAKKAAKKLSAKKASAKKSSNK
jgi:hypothetical protein